MVKADQPSLMTDFIGLDVAKNNVAGPTSSSNGNTTMKGDLPLASVHEVNDRMENSLYRYFIGKRLSFSGVECFVRILIEINACNEFSDHLVMVVPNLEGSGYTKETIRIEYERKPPRCSICLIFGHSPIDCPKVIPKRVVDQKDKGKGQTSDADDEGFIEMMMGNHWKRSYPDDLGNDDEIEPIDNEMTTFLASNPIGVGYGLKILLEQWRENNLEDHYNPYDDNMYGSRNS
nr:hypothetical protein [Tanacetum cinerariifolium]